MVFIPLLAMGSVDAGRLYTGLLLAAFLGWPLAGVAAFAAARLLERRPRAAIVLLILAGAGLLFPFFIGGILALVAAAFAFRSRNVVATPPPGGWIKAKDVSRAVGIGFVAVVALVFVIPSLFSIVIFLRSGDGDGGSSAAEPTQLPFTAPDEALRDYAEAWAPPFLGECPGLGESGTCVETSEVSADVASYRLCAMASDQCVTVHVARKEAAWAVTGVEKMPDSPKP